MSNQTVTRAFLSEAVFKEVGLSRTESLEIIDDFLEVISKALETEEQVKLAGFGTFVTRQKTERVGRNPKTKQEVMITPRRVVTFRSSRMMRDEVNSSQS